MPKYLHCSKFKTMLSKSTLHILCITLVTTFLFQACKKETPQSVCPDVELDASTTIDADDYEVINAFLSKGSVNNYTYHIHQKTFLVIV